MNDSIEFRKTQIKNKIKGLIENQDLETASALMDEYFLVIQNDIEAYSMKAVILIMLEKLDDAEKLIKEGLKLDNKDFDLNFNLAYIYEISGKYNKSIIYYKRARKTRYYDSQVKNQIDNIINNIYENFIYQIKLEQSSSEIYTYLEKIQSVLIVDLNLSDTVNNLAQMLDEYGIDIDLAYAGPAPDRKFSNYNLPYRKLLGITAFDDLIEYINYYSYDIVQLFNVPKNIEDYLVEKCEKKVIINNDLLSQEVNDVLGFYSNNTIEKKVNYINSINDVTILIPTYNRPQYLQRALIFFNNFKNLKPYIIVLDSSFEENKKINSDIVRNLNDERISYFHFDSNINFFRKLNFGINIITTDYVTLCADDDFLTEEGIIESVISLEKDKSLYSVKGKNLYFIETMAKLIEYDYFKGLYEETAVERLESIVEGFVPTLLYQVFRVDKFKNMYLFIEEHIDELPDNFIFQEYLFYFMVICTGRLGKINVDLNIRDKSIPRETEIKNFPHAVLERNFNSNYIRFRLFLSEYIKVIREDKEQFDKLIPGLFCDFLVNFLNVPKENVILNDDVFDLEQLEIGMRKSWVWPLGL